MCESAESQLAHRPGEAATCPICGYALAGLGSGVRRPECGRHVDHGLLCSEEMHAAVDSCKDWCMAGIIAWIMFAIPLWLICFASLAAFQQPGQPGLAILARCVFALSASTPVLLCIRWRRCAGSLVYRRCIASGAAPRTPGRVIIIASLGLPLTMTLCSTYGLQMS